MKLCRLVYNILIELSDLTGFFYDLSDTEDKLKCLGMGFIFCGKRLLMKRIQVSDQGPMGPLVLSIDGHMKKTSGSLVGLKGVVRVRSGKSLMLATRVLLFNCFGWNITIHGNRKASRSVIELGIEPIFNLYFW